MSELCRCADEVRCDMRAEIERLTALSWKLHNQWLQSTDEIEAKDKRIAELEALLNDPLELRLYINKKLEDEKTKP